MFIIHSYCLVIFLDFSLKMHQIDAFKYKIFKMFFQWSMDPLRGVKFFSPFSPLTRFHARNGVCLHYTGLLNYIAAH